MAEGGRLSGRIVSKVAARKEASEEELPSLYDAVEPDALENLFCHAHTKPGAELKIQFTYAGYTVVIRNTGDITLENSHVLQSDSDT